MHIKTMQIRNFILRCRGDHDIKRQLIKLWTIFLSGGGGGGSGFWTLAHTDLTQKLRVDFDEKFLACLFQ